MTGFKSTDGFDANGSQYTNGSSATADTSLPTLGQVKQLINDISRRRVKAAAPGNVTLTAPGATVDGVTMTAGDRFFTPFQTDATTIGIYVWNGAATAATRATDANTGALLANVEVVVDQGTTYADRRFRVLTDTITLGTTPIVVSQLSDQGTALTDDGTTTQISAGVVSVRAPYQHKTFTQAVPASAGPYTYAHSLAAIPVHFALQEQVTGQWYGVASGGLSADATNVYLTLPGTPASGQYRIVAFA